jgi:hypothetical protein
MGLHKIKKLLTAKEMVSKLKRPPTESEKKFASYISDKGLINRELKKLNSAQMNEPFKKWATELNRTSCEEEIQMAKKHMKNAHHSYQQWMMVPFSLHPCQHVC